MMLEIAIGCLILVGLILLNVIGDIALKYYNEHERKKRLKKDVEGYDSK